MSHSVVFFGSGPVAAKSLESVAKHFTIEAVITKAIPAHHKGTAPVEELVRELDLPILFASNKSELDELFETRKFKSSLGIIIDYGVIVSKSVIDRFELGILNSHFSLLPEWRGADPITFSLLSGQKKTGVSLMIIEPAMDTGKLIAQKGLFIDSQDTTPILTDRLIDLSNEMIIQYVPAYQAGEIKPKQQPHPDRATYSRKLTKQDGILDFQKPASQLECEVRAYRGWPGSRTTIFDKTIIVTKSHVSSEQKTPLDVLCGDGAYFSIDELIGPSGKTMNAQSFLNGYAAG